MRITFTKENIKNVASETVGAIGESFSALLSGGAAAMLGIKAGLKVGGAPLTAVTVVGGTVGVFMAKGVGKLAAYLTTPTEELDD